MLSLCSLVLLITGATFTAGNQTRALTAALTRQHQQLLVSIRASVSVVVVVVVVNESKLRDISTCYTRRRYSSVNNLSRNA